MPEVGGSCVGFAVVGLGVGGGLGKGAEVVGVTVVGSDVDVGLGVGVTVVGEIVGEGVIGSGWVGKGLRRGLFPVLQNSGGEESLENIIEKRLFFSTQISLPSKLLIQYSPSRPRPQFVNVIEGLFCANDCVIQVLKSR